MIASGSQVRWSMGPMVVGRWVKWSMGSWVIFFAMVYGGGWIWLIRAMVEVFFFSFSAVVCGGGGDGGGFFFFSFPVVVRGGGWMWLVGAMVELFFFFSTVVCGGGWMWLVEAMVGFCWLWHGWQVCGGCGMGDGFLVGSWVVGFVAAGGAQNSWVEKEIEPEGEKRRIIMNKK